MVPARCHRTDYAAHSARTGKSQTPLVARAASAAIIKGPSDCNGSPNASNSRGWHLHQVVRRCLSLIKAAYQNAFPLLRAKSARASVSVPWIGDSGKSDGDRASEQARQPEDALAVVMPADPCGPSQHGRRQCGGMSVSVQVRNGARRAKLK